MPISGSCSLGSSPCLYLESWSWSSKYISQHPTILMELPNPSVKNREKKIPMLNKWFCFNDEYIYIKVTTKEVNDEHHQHQCTYRDWCAWLIVNSIPSYMKDTDGNFVILKSYKLLSLLNFEWDLKFYYLHMKFDEVGTTLKHPKTINCNVKNLSKSDILLIFHFDIHLIFHFLSFCFKNLILPSLASL